MPKLCDMFRCAQFVRFRTPQQQRALDRASDLIAASCRFKPCQATVRHIILELREAFGPLVG
jgi:hypothetical protein